MSKRQTKQGQQYKKNRKTTSSPQQEKKEGMSTATKVVIGVFAVLMALSMSGVFSLIGNVAGGSSSTATTDTTGISSIDDIDAAYSDYAAQLEEKVAADATDLDSTLSLASLYMSWGYNVAYLATIDSETSHANELFSKAIALYDTYIAAGGEEAGEAKVDRALCLLYSGETSNALNALKSITEEDPTNAIAWANYGYVCEIMGDSDTARSAYDQAIANDPDDEHGAKSYASSRILALNDSDSESLPGTIRDLSGVSI